MFTKQHIEQVIESQRERLLKAGSSLPRSIEGYENLSSHALIVTGVRRCGKSTLLQQINTTLSQPSVYINFEDPRLAGFELRKIVYWQQPSKNASNWFIIQHHGLFKLPE